MHCPWIYVQSKYINGFLKILVLGHKCPFLVWSQTSWSQKGGHKRPGHKRHGHKRPCHKRPPTLSNKCIIDIFIERKPRRLLCNNRGGN